MLSRICTRKLFESRGLPSPCKCPSCTAPENGSPEEERPDSSIMNPIMEPTMNPIMQPIMDSEKKTDEDIRG